MRRLVLGCFVLAWSTGCTPIRPLFAGEMDGGGSATDGGTDASAPDAGHDAGPDGGCNASVLDVCNGMDDDCDPSSADGSEDPMLGMPCPATCLPGTYDACTAGALVCSSVAPETCNGIDDDCNGMIDDNPATGTVYYRDADGDSYGDTSTMTRLCHPLAMFVTRNGDCDDTNPMIHPGVTDACDGIDNDCNGVIDDSGTFGLCGTSTCMIQHYNSHAYLFCNTDLVTMSAAQTSCMSHGYHLVIVDDAGEEMFIGSGGGTSIRNGVWIGLMETGTTYDWVDGTALGAYTAWDPGEPSTTGTCVRARRVSGSGAIPPTWFATSCTMTSAYICEAP